MSTRVHPDPLAGEPAYVQPIGHEGQPCPHGIEHDRYRFALETALRAGAGNHPSFARRNGPDGRLEALTASMLCGCTFVALVVE